MSEEELKRILLTTGYTTQTDKDAVYIYINQLKEVIEEVRGKLKLQRKVALSLKHPYTVSNIDEVLQILDKVGDENEQ